MRGKQGMFFTAIALMIVIILVLAFSPQKPVVLAEEISALQTRANVVNEQAKAVVKSYTPQAIYVSAYSAFYALAEYMRIRQSYFPAGIFNGTFKEVMINGTICCSLPGSPVACDDTDQADINDPSKHIGVDHCIGLPLMRDKNLSVKLRQIENISFIALRVTTEFNKNYNNMNVTLYQDNATGPWQVGVNVTLNYSVSVGDVSINDTQNISVMFGIEGIPDPLYAVGSQTAPEDLPPTPYTLRFNATNITNWNISNLYKQLEWRVYRHDKNASSFLMRFYGIDERSPCCGIESLINPYVMGSVNGARERPYVDWCYYGPGNRCTAAQTGAMWNVTCITTETDGTRFYRFAIDSYHAAEYNITEYLYSVGPPPACPEKPPNPLGFP